jgi:hypothetical protein
MPVSDLPDLPHSQPSPHTMRVAVPLELASPEAVAVELLWAEPLPRGRYAIRSIPFQVDGIHLNDVVHVTGGKAGSPRADECPVVTQVIKRSGHSTFHLSLHVASGSGPFARLWTRLSQLGCTFEKRSGQAIAVDVPPTARMHLVDEVLEAGEIEGVWTLEEPIDEHPIAS